MSANSRVAIVTGAGKGIGRAIALSLGQDGVAISVWDRNEREAFETVESINANGGRAIACVVDAAIPSEIRNAVGNTRSEFGAIGILVNNAGLSSFSKFEDISEAALDEMLAVNLKGPFLCIQSVITDMVQANWGRIINISSSSAQSGAPNMSHYIASKGGVMGLTKALAIEFASFGITVNNIPPGYIDTPMLRRIPHDLDDVSATLPMKRMGKPSEIAAACSFLASESAGYITGQTISINGGRYLL